MSKEVWLEAYERVYNESEGFLTEDEMVKKANNLAADIEASKTDAAMERMKEDEPK